jgi:cytochrome P450
MVNLDDPQHARMRGIISRAFTPRLVAKIEEDIRQVVLDIVVDVRRLESGDFVEAVATQLPFQVICNMMGIPVAHRRQILDQVNHATEHIGVNGPGHRVRMPGKSLAALARMHRLVANVAHDRRKRPTDDLISTLVNADVDGKKLTVRELGAFFSLLLVAGVETTRNAIAHALKLLTDHPEQKSLLLSDVDQWAPGAVEEVIRYASPIIQFRRTLAHDYEMNGQMFAGGADVMLFYNSANRDARVFPAPDTFDISRKPNPHVGFGGGGPHYCLGAYLARQEMAVLFRELFGELPTIRSTGEPELIPSNFDNRVKHLRFVV